jgi:histidinol phosphatase-like PHP family hydrolase
MQNLFASHNQFDGRCETTRNPLRTCKQEEVMPKNAATIEWIEPWEEIGELGEAFSKELQKEVAPGHQLHGIPAEAIGHRIDCDNAVFRLEDDVVAVVHLTWSRKQEPNSDYPRTEVYASIDDFVDKRMRPDSEEYSHGASM